MALSCMVSSFSSPNNCSSNLKLRLCNHYLRLSEVRLLSNSNVINSSSQLKFKGFSSNRRYIVFSAASVDPLDGELNHNKNDGDLYFESNSDRPSERTAGKPGLISFYNKHRNKDNKIRSLGSGINKGSPVWVLGPFLLVASFIFPSLYLRRILSGIFEDSLLTDFLILFFTEAIFYFGTVGFLVLVDFSRNPACRSNNNVIDMQNSPELAYRISSVATLVLSLLIPMATMGLVWPWTGPAASATLAPYLVGIVVQFAFQRYANHLNSPSCDLIPIIFQVYRLHQLNRAAQLVTALSFTVRGAEMTAHNLAISTSLGTLLNVLHLLGVICIWSLSSFLINKFNIRGMEHQKLCHQDY